MHSHLELGEQLLVIIVIEHLPRHVGLSLPQHRAQLVARPEPRRYVTAERVRRVVQADDVHVPVVVQLDAASGQSSVLPPTRRNSHNKHLHSNSILEE